MEGWGRIWAGAVGEAQMGGSRGRMGRAVSQKYGGYVENGRRENGRGRVRGAVVGGDGGRGGGAVEDESRA